MDFLEQNCINTRRLKLPASVKAFTTLQNGCFYIFINDSMDAEETQRALQHELEHIRQGDFTSTQNVQELESIRHLND